MKYENTVKGKFISRPNRFIAIVEIDGIKEVCHVKNTGRCKELLIPGVTVILEKSSNEKRKTKYDVLAVYKGDSSPTAKPASSNLSQPSINCLQFLWKVISFCFNSSIFQASFILFFRLACYFYNRLFLL